MAYIRVKLQIKYQRELAIGFPSFLVQSSFRLLRAEYELSAVQILPVRTSVDVLLGVSQFTLVLNDHRWEWDNLLGARDCGTLDR